MKTPTLLKRKKEGVTDYRKRLNLLKSESPRLVVRVSRKGLTAQIAEYDPDGDIIKGTVTSRVLEKNLGVKGNNTQSCYLAGYYLGKVTQKKDIDYAILDIGRFDLVKGGRIASVLKGFIDSGVEVPCSEEIFPNKERLNGKHLKAPLNLEEFKKKIDEKVK
ncbi:MAG: 50S ribosomal protein L18 [Cuniculiplasma sp.]